MAHLFIPGAAFEQECVAARDLQLKSRMVEVIDPLLSFRGRAHAGVALIRSASNDCIVPGVSSSESVLPGAQGRFRIGRVLKQWN